MLISYELNCEAKEAVIKVKNNTSKIVQNWFIRCHTPITVSSAHDLSVATDSLSLMFIPYPEKMYLKPDTEVEFRISYREDVDLLELETADPTVQSFMMYDEDFTKHISIKDIPYLHYFYNPKKVGRFIKNNNPNPDFVRLEEGLTFESDDVECYAHAYAGFFDSYNYVLKFTVKHEDNYAMLMRLGEMTLEREKNKYIFKYKKEIKCTFYSEKEDVEIELEFRFSHDGCIKFSHRDKKYSIICDTSILDPVYLDFGAMDTWNAKSTFRRLSLEKKK